MFPVLEIGEILGDQSTINSDYNCELGRIQNWTIPNDQIDRSDKNGRSVQK